MKKKIRKDHSTFKETSATQADNTTIFILTCKYYLLYLPAKSLTNKFSERLLKEYKEKTLG